MPWEISTTISISLIVLPLYIYIVLRLASAFSKIASISQKKTRSLLFTIIAWLYTLPIIFIAYYVNGKTNQLFLYKLTLGWQDYLFLFPFWLGIIIVLEILPFFIFWDLLRLASRLAPFSFIKKWLKWDAYFKIGILLFFIVYVSVRSYYDTNKIRIKHIEISFNHLPVEFQNLRICLMGDIQVDRYTQPQKIIQVKKILQSLNNDISFFTGDLVTNRKEHIHQALDVICESKDNFFCFACIGDHDFWVGPKAIPEALTKCGWKFLQNQHYLFEHNEHQILVTGITHIYSRYINKSSLRTILAKAPEADLKILFVHQPSEMIIEVAKEYDYHLLLAGHTHGGQIVFHLFGIPWTACQMQTKFWKGNYKINKLWVLVTNGIGMTLAPVRYHAPAEIIIITLVSNKCSF